MPDAWEELLHFEIPSRAGLERKVMDRVGDTVKDLLDAPVLERLKTAVAEGTLNAIEHGNHFREDLPVEIVVFCSPLAVRVLITDLGGGQMVPTESTVPNLEAKLAGLEPTRGWGWFLIRNMVNEVDTIVDGNRHTLILISYRENAL